MQRKWAVITRDFSRWGRVYTTGEVVEDRADKIGVLVHEKKAKITTAPASKQAETSKPADPIPAPKATAPIEPNHPSRMVSTEPIQGGDIVPLAWNPQEAFAITDTEPQPDAGDDVAYEPDAGPQWIGGADKPVEPAEPIFRRRKKSKPLDA